MLRLATVLSAALALVLVGGCAGTADMQKTVSGRHTVALSQPDLNDPSVFDRDFTADKLRAVDPCATLRSAGLSRYGKPGQDSVLDLGSCMNTMSDHAGKPFTATLSMNADVYDASKHMIAGLPSSVEPDEGSCTVKSAYRGGEGGVLAIQQGLELDLSSESPDSCTAAVQVMSAVINTIRTDPPVFSRESGSLAAYDPCAMLDAPEVAAASKGGTGQPSASGMYECAWNTNKAVTLRVSFDVGEPDSPTGPPLDLDGIPASVRRQGSGGCEVQWQHRKNVDSMGSSELVDVEVSKQGKLKWDPCASATGVARGVRAKLPTA